jgi:hypothetical protein
LIVMRWRLAVAVACTVTPRSAFMRRMPVKTSGSSAVSMTPRRAS